MTAALRGLLDKLDGAAVEVDTLALHTPDLDDVFLALTSGQAAVQPHLTAPAVTRWYGPRGGAR